MEKALKEHLENAQTAPHKFPSVADIKDVEKIDVYHGSRNFFEKYDYTRARTTGGAQYGLGQYFTTKENMAYSYATLDKETPFIEKNIETNGEKVATQKVVYHGEISGADLNKIIVPEKMTDADYDVLIKAAREQGKDALAEELVKIKSTADRHVDLCQWLRKTESVDLMQSVGINGVYSMDRDIYAIYDTANMNIKIKEAVVLDGTEIPKSLIADNSAIHIQESVVEKAESAHILSTKGSILQRTGKSEGANITALIEPSASKQPIQTAEQTVEKNIVKEIMSNHFDNLNKPSVVSIGLYAEGDYRATDIKKVVSTLRENGIDAVLATSDEAKDLKKFVVDETGIRTPVLSPEDAKLATKDIINILDDNDIKIMGHALPQTNDNLTYTSFIKQDTGLKEINIAEKEFVSSQLSKVSDMPEVLSFNKNSIYRGGPLGNRPYAVISAFAHSRDCAYASEDVEIARIFSGANKDAWAGRAHFPEVNGKAYGFLYEYEKAPDQLIYDNYGIENRKVIPNGSYETPVFEHRNKIKAIYLECDGKIVQIAGENGKYISPEWERFAELHNPIALNTDMERIARDNGIKAAAESGRTTAYVRRDPQELAKEEKIVRLIEKEKVAKLALKEQAKAAEQTVSQTAEKAATKTTLKAQAAYTARKAGQAAKMAAKTTGKATKETLLAMNKAYDDTFDAIIKWGDKHAPQWMNKVEEVTIQKAAEKFMQTKSGQAIAKQIEKKIGKEAAASIAKKIPILCLGVGAMCVYDRLKEREYWKAVGDGVSAIAYMVPGPGTLAGLGIDTTVLSDDLGLFAHGVMQADPNSHMAAESTGYDNQLKRMNEAIERQNKEAKSQKEVRAAAKKYAPKEAAKAIENIKNMTPWGNSSRT